MQIRALSKFVPIVRELQPGLLIDRPSRLLCPLTTFPSEAVEFFDSHFRHPAQYPELITALLDAASNDLVQVGFGNAFVMFH
jgi:hypothetical protein